VAPRPHIRVMTTDHLQAEAAFQQALILHRQGWFDQAERLYRQALNLEPQHFNSWHQLGIIAAQSGDHQRAVELFGRALTIDPRSAVACHNQGNALRALGKHADALASYDRSIDIKPDNAEVHFNRGIALAKLKRQTAAIASYDRAIALRADYADAYNNRGNALRLLARCDAALQDYEKAIELRPNDARAFFNRGVALAELGRHEAAIASYATAIELNRAYVDAYNNRGNLLRGLEQCAAAIDDFRRAIALAPQQAEAHNNLGITLLELKQYEDAAASFARCVALDSGDVITHINRGIALAKLQRYDAALASFAKAIALDPKCVAAYQHHGETLCELRQFEGAACSFEKALELEPDLPFLAGTLLHVRMQLCDWRNLAAATAGLVERLTRGEAVSPPFPLLAWSGSPALQRRAADIWARAECPRSGPPIVIEKRAKRPKLRIGYFSGDFRGHAVSYLTAGVFETHDRSRFEVLAFSFSADTQDEMRGRLRRAFDRFIDVRGMSDEEVAGLARSLQIDIAVDLGGFTLGSRLGIFALRAAPLQVGYLGYLGTIAAPYMDYLIADESIVPQSQREHYAEKIIYLESYQANDSKREIVGESFTRAQLGLPAQGFVFCCFNANYKITPDTFEGWMRILGRVAGSVLFLYAGNATAEGNLRKEASRRGVDAGRLVFDRWRPRREYLARFHAADLFLDTLPYNAGTTASDALWVGLPVLTCMGESFAGRVAGSVLRAIELPELIAGSPGEYERMAVELASEPVRLQAIREKLVRNRSRTRLFDTARLTADLERAYEQIHARYLDDLPPEHVGI
jgi:protein O-GlcNAc transferase